MSERQRSASKPHAGKREVVAPPVRPRPHPREQAIQWTPWKLWVTETTVEAGWDVVLTQSLLATILEQVLWADSDVGGVLGGKLFRCPTSGQRWVRADAVWRSPVTVSEACDTPSLTRALGSATFDADDDTRMRVGWYHSHARLGVTLTESERDFHELEFIKPWQFALILVARSDPAGGVFQRGAGGVLSRTAYVPFYELPLAVRSDGSRQTMVHWQNYTTDSRVHLVDPAALRNLSSGDARGGSGDVRALFGPGATVPPRLEGPATRPRRSRGRTRDPHEERVRSTEDDARELPDTGSRRRLRRAVAATAVVGALLVAGWYGWERYGSGPEPTLEFSAAAETGAVGLHGSQPASPEIAFLDAMTSLERALETYAALESSPGLSCDALVAGVSELEGAFREAAIAYAALSLAAPGGGRIDYESAATRMVELSRHFAGSGCDRPRERPQQRP